MFAALIMVLVPAAGLAVLAILFGITCLIEQR